MKFCKPINIPFSADVKHSESALQQDIMLAASAAGHRLWRNNVGMGWVGKLAAGYPQDGMVMLLNARPIHFGLADGSSDLIGIQRGTGRFLSAEVKPRHRGRLTADQCRWLEMIRGFGGIAAEVRSVEEALAAIAS